MKTISQLLPVVLMSLFFYGCGPELKKNYWENGNTRSVLEYKDEMLNGTATWYFENGNKEQEVTYINN